jgi:magnesium chelatase family protein
LNRQLSSIQIRELNLMTPGAQRLLEVIADRGELSARGFVRVLRVAHTIADLDRSDAVSERHLAEALSYRSLERLSAYAQLSG